MTLQLVSKRANRKSERLMVSLKFSLSPITQERRIVGCVAMDCCCHRLTKVNWSRAIALLEITPYRKNLSHWGNSSLLHTHIHTQPKQPDASHWYLKDIRAFSFQWLPGCWGWGWRVECVFMQSGWFSLTIKEKIHSDFLHMWSQKQQLSLGRLGHHLVRSSNRELSEWITICCLNSWALGF